MAEGEMDNLTMEQYLALTRGNQAPGVVKPEIEGNVNFEIKSQFMRELREDTFFGNKNDDAHEHVERVLDIVGLFNIPGVTHDAVMLRVFPITLTGAAKWYCPPSKTAKQLEEIRNFKQDGDETLYQAWERYNDLLYKCPTNDINNHQKVNIFYNGLGTMNRQLLDSQGPIPGMTPNQALTAIQTMADHSQKWHDNSSTKSINNENSEGITCLVNKLENLGRDMKKLKENVHAIQVGCQNCQGPHLDKDCPLREEIQSIKEVKYGEFNRPFDGRFNKGNYNPQSSERKPSLTEIMNKFINETTKRHAEQDEWLKFFYQSTESSRNTHNKIIQDLDSRVKNLAKEVDERTSKEEPEECKVIYSADGIPLYIPFEYSPEEIEYFATHPKFSKLEEPKILKSEKKETLEAITETKQNVSHYIEPYEPPIPYPRRLEQHAEEALVNQTMESLKEIRIVRKIL
ncbi:hypothetical protein Tco_0105885 [Tanacetum coccineum]